MPYFIWSSKPAAGEQFVELAAPLGDLEPAVLDLLEAGLARELVGVLARQEDVRAMLQQVPRQADRGPRRAHPGDRSGAAGAAVHQRRVEFDVAVVGEHAAAPGVEARILFEQARRGLDRIERAPAAAEDRRAGGQRFVESRRARSIPGRRSMSATPIAPAPPWITNRQLPVIGRAIAARPRGFQLTSQFDDIIMISN